MIRDPGNTAAPEIALGSAQLGLAYGIAGSKTVPAIEDSFALLDLAWERGIRRIDTAPGYGLAEVRIGEFIAQRGLAGKLQVCTKLPELGASNTAAQHWVDEHVMASLRALQVTTLDCLLLHSAADLITHGEALIDPLLAQQARNNIGRIGVSVYAPDELDLLSRFPTLSAVQLPANLFDQRFLPAMRNSSCLANIEVQIRSVFLQGLLSLAPSAVPEPLSLAKPALEKLHRLCSKHGLEPTTLALGYAMQLPADFVVLGVDNPTQLTRNLDNSEGTLTTEVLEVVESLFDGLPASVIDPRSW